MSNYVTTLANNTTALNKVSPTVISIINNFFFILYPFIIIAFGNYLYILNILTYSHYIEVYK